MLLRCLFGTLFSTLFLDGACVLVLSPLLDDKLQGRHWVIFTADVVPSIVPVGAR